MDDTTPYTHHNKNTQKTPSMKLLCLPTQPQTQYKSNNANTKIKYIKIQQKEKIVEYK